MNALARAQLTNGLLAWCFLCLSSFHQPSAAADDTVVDDTLIKTAFIYNFAKFTRWPLETWANSQSPLHLCTTGEDELVGSLPRLDRETIGGRPVIISTFDPGVASNACHILYVAASEHRHFSRFIQQTRDAPVLTISEIRGFADAGGIIQLYRDNRQIRFKINLGVARDRGLNLSARLLDLAELVDSRVAP